MLKSFIESFEGQYVRLYTRECVPFGYCEGIEDTDHFVTGVFLGLRYNKRFRYLAVENDRRVNMVRLKDVVRVEPLAAGDPGASVTGLGDLTVGQKEHDG